MKRWFVTALLVLGLLLSSVSIQAQEQPDSGILAGANLNLPFVRRSWVTCGFGCYPGHVGVDYRASNFTPVVAAKEGTVTAIRNDCLDPDGGGFNPCAGQGYGNYVYISHGSGYETRYAHLAQSGFNVWVGKAVVRGEQMALSDNSGNSFGPHLHFELRVNGTAVDPYAGSTHWAGSDTFPIGYRDQNGAVHGPFPLDNVKIRNKWVTEARQLGSPITNDSSFPCLAEGLQATGYMQGFERGYIAYCGGGSAQVTYYNQTFLPRILASEDANAWNSTVSIRNLGTVPANVSISFLRSNGTVLDSRLYAGLPVNATWELRASTVVFD
ncbi:MAG: M23 family metallopeptidase, partial [Anaerolineae bacterium]